MMDASEQKKQNNKKGICLVYVIILSEMYPKYLFLADVIIEVCQWKV